LFLLQADSAMAMRRESSLAGRGLERAASIKERHSLPFRLWRRMTGLQLGAAAVFGVAAIMLVLGVLVGTRVAPTLTSAVAAASTAPRRGGTVPAAHAHRDPVTWEARLGTTTQRRASLRGGGDDSILVGDDRDDDPVECDQPAGKPRPNRRPLTAFIGIQVRAA
jgi:hypothetical protein